MKSTFIGVPFKGEKGLSEINGLAKFSSAGIVFEFESKLFGLVGGGVKEVLLSLEDILDVKFKKGFFKYGASIHLRLKNFEKLTALPNDSGKVKLKIERQDFALAESAVNQTLQYLDQQQEQLPPAQTSIGDTFETDELRTKDSRETNKLNDH